MNKTQPKDGYLDIFYKIPEALERKSYKKLIVLGLSISFGITLAITLAVLQFNRIDNHSKQRKADFNILTSSLKKDYATEYPKFLQYMKVQQNIYDQKIDYVTEVAMKAPKEKKGNEEFVSPSRVQSLNTDHSKYKVYIGEQLITIQNVYQHVLNNQLDDINADTLKDFLTFYQSFKANMMYHDKDLEEDIHSILYNSYEGNRIYNIKYNVYNNLKIIDKNMEIKINNSKIQ